jgi:uncharacterized DUF497 family protein
MAFYFFIWTDRAMEKISERDISIEEVEEIISHPDRTGISRTSGRPIAVGETSSGRTLLCVYEEIDGTTIQPITAFEI